MKNWRTTLRGSEFKIMRLSEGPADNTILDQPDIRFQIATEALNALNALHMIQGFSCCLN